jgi:hypothetical protein
MSFSNNASEFMRGDASGNVLVGKTATGFTTLGAEIRATGFIAATVDNGTCMLLNRENTDGTLMSFQQDGTTHGSISIQGTLIQLNGQGGQGSGLGVDTGGNVLVGKTSTDSNVAGHEFRVGTSEYKIITTNDNDECAVFNRLTTDGSLVSFRQDGTTHGSISISGSTTSYNTSSDHRLKENVVPMTGALARIDALKPSRFNFIAKPDRVVDGFIAHEVQEVVPEAVTGEKDAMKTEEFVATPALGDIFTPAVPAVLDEEGNELEAAIDEIIHDSGVEKPDELADGVQWRETQAAVMGEKESPDYQGIDQSKLVPLLVGAIQELKAEVEALKANAV